ncbi:MAG: serine/threonine protein kinase [Ignavibacteriales bacterium]|nr:serine/threonine protein kinase [Ignavibacteriales bacterium]
MQKNILFEKFEILDTLKKDDIAAVYLANHIYLGKKIILKSLNTQLLPDESVIERFKREAKILAKLEHPNIIKVLDFGIHQHFFYISFEYFESENLRVALSQKKFSDEEKKHLLVQMLKGLQYAHGNGIIHRDIKPENILVNNALEIKIGDFGLALSQSDLLLTQQYSLVGTPSYMSPEQIQGEPLTAQTDLFSLGIVAFEMFKGKHPFLGNDINETINNIINCDEERLFATLNDVPSEVQTVIKKLLRKNLNERYQNADDILAIFGTEPKEISFQRNGRENRIKKVVLLGGAISFVVLVVFLYFRNNPSEQPYVQNVPFANQESVATQMIDSQKILPQINFDTNRVHISLSKKTKLDTTDSKSLPDKGFSSAKEESLELNTIIPTKQFGELYVECLPWAEVYVDSVKKETTPLRKNISLASGTHQLKLVHPDFPLYQTLISIEPEQITSVQVNLDTLFGFFVCDVFPWGEVFIDGVWKGNTPLREAIRILPGEHRVTVKNTQYGFIDRTMTFFRNDTVRFQHKFEGQ